MNFIHKHSTVIIVSAIALMILKNVLPIPQLLQEVLSIVSFLVVVSVVIIKKRYKRTS
ncbi:MULTISPECIES: hypothetical protein [Robertmurraya]|uniref:Uncharacterized protein n=1 Tax=Robertmurraya beringensis TaxID=641660 RepID=A0ABV6KX36_9BACI|nr:Uncharacterised protein [Mycobacteroides abscessus subsp. abscessus]